MKRLTAPEIRDTKNPAKHDIQITREALPPQWVIAELFYHALFLYNDVDGYVSVRSILNVASSVPTGIDAELLEELSSMFLTTYERSRHKNQVLHEAFMDTVPEEEQAAWEELPILERSQAYINRRNEGLPQYQMLVDAGNFLLGEYRHIPADLRNVTDLAFSGLLFSALTDPAFSSLCKDKSRDMSGMSIEEKMDVPLDHEALYNFLLEKLGVEAAA